MTNGRQKSMNPLAQKVGKKSKKTKAPSLVIVLNEELLEIIYLYINTLL